MSHTFGGVFALNGISERKEFQVASGVMRVTDPCYDMDTWCAGEIPAANGTWIGHVGYGTDPDDLKSALKWWDEHLKEETEFAKKLAENVPADKRDAYAKHMLDSHLLRRPKPSEESCRRVQYIHVVHQSLATELDAPTVFTDYELVDKLHVGVDSGQAGFFDRGPYAEAVSDKDHRGREGARFEAFYDHICEQTLGPTQFAGNGYGVASSSGWGDGGYSCYVKKDAAGQAVAAFIAFIWDGGDEEEEGDDA
ncbi:DUF4241 domain-containing protein [Cupriavidus campinensis]|uniref:DUF4241 domain-containing protein n=1 Tax=Cupriavidus campinensis TaxID=151783 RepID=A0ABY3ESW3_9BURK|nr:DUF4241 domain-containing protein [Cupriavidus campinensis]TSP14056.1 DUF4241 domain-containing protein [Cupriavidus campinensis]